MQKISALAIHTESLELSFTLFVKSQKFDQKFDFVEIFSKTKNILRLELTRKQFSTRWLKNIDTHFLHVKDLSRKDSSNLVKKSRALIGQIFI